MLTNTTEIGTATLPRRRLTIPAPTDVSPSAPRRPPRFPALAQFASAARRVPRAPIPVAFALAVLAVLATVAPEPAAAQTTFISNTGQTAPNASTDVRATAFTTGTGTYTLLSVGILIPFTQHWIPVVAIYGDTGGNPGTLLATMTNPGTYEDNAVHTFTAPANTPLSASRTYWLVTSNSAATNGTGFWVGLIGSTNLDSGTAAGWSIGNARFKSDIDDASWGISSARIRFEIRGTGGTTTNNPPTGAPTITGTAQVGQTLTAGTTAIMDADGLTSVSYAYQWIRTAAGVDTNIASATAITYTLVGADLGKTVKVRVSFTDDASNPETLTSTATEAVSPPPPPNIPPEVVTRLVDQEATTGDLFTYVIPADAFTDADGDRLTYAAVLSDGGRLPAWLTFDPATRTFTGTPQTADVGTVSVKVTASDGNGGSVSDEFDITVSAAANNLATGAPTITGTAQVGQMLTAVTTGIMDADGLTSVSYAYQWIRVDGGTETNISGATTSTHTLVAADQGKTIKVRVSFTDDASNAETLTSTATAVVSAAPNTLPSASDGTVTTNEDTARTFAAADFNFLDTDPGDTLSNVRIVTLPASGKGTLALSGTPVTANQVVAATNIGTLTYTPPANANGTGYASFTFKVSDGTAESAADYTMTITVTAVNDAPTVATAIPDQPATAGTAFSYAFPANTFSDADIGDTLTYAATKADGATLPAWLSFAAGTRTFSGTPQAADIGTVAVKVTASDGNGGSVSDTFDITVSAAGDTTPPTLTSATVFEGGVFINLQFSENMLQSNLPSTDTFTVTAAGSAVTVYTVQAALAPAPLNAFWILVRPTIQQGQVVVVTYTDPTAGDDANAIQNTAGNDAATFTTGMDGVPAVTNNSITNTPATGAPTITGTATVGQTLTAVTTGIMDADGLRQLHVPVDPGGRHGRRHFGSDGEHLHAGGGRPGHDDQGDGELHRRRQ